MSPMACVLVKIGILDSLQITGLNIIYSASFIFDKMK
jgi:hypothetical protein